MNTKRFVLAAIAAFVVTFAIDFGVHGILLDATYKATADLWRPEAEMQSLMPFMFLTQILISLVLAFIFTRHYEGKGVGEGVRFGLYMGVLLAIPQFGSYCYLPIPFSLALIWTVTTIFWGVVVGIVLALVYRGPEATA